MRNSTRQLFAAFVVWISVCCSSGIVIGQDRRESSRSLLPAEVYKLSLRPIQHQKLQRLQDEFVQQQQALRRRYEMTARGILTTTSDYLDITAWPESF